MGRLEPLPNNEYIVAFGPEGVHFYATPQGYHATCLPFPVIQLLSQRPDIKRIVWASYGCVYGSWFFAFQCTDGTYVYTVGPRTPSVIRGLVGLLRKEQGSNQLGLLRVQLGLSGSFFASIGTQWTSSGLPELLMCQLREMSSTNAFFSDKAASTFAPKYGELQNIQWCPDGSYWIQFEDVYRLNFQSPAATSAWYTLWVGTARHNIKDRLKMDLACVSLNSYENDYFLFLKKRDGPGEVPYIFQFGPLCKNMNISEHATSKDIQEQAQDQSRWAVVTRNGRPYKSDYRELELQKGTKVKIIRDMGRAWYIVEGPDNDVGWAHGLWLDLGDQKTSRKPKGKARYEKFELEVERLMSHGQIRSFISWGKYVKKCKDDGCAALEVCVHDLRKLLEGSGHYSYEYLKKTRNLWHPDKFAQYCHPDHVEELKAKAGEIFVLYTMLMDREKPEN